MTALELREQWQIARKNTELLSKQMESLLFQLGLESALVCAMLPDEPAVKYMRELVEKRKQVQIDLAQAHSACDAAFNTYMAGATAFSCQKEQSND